MDNSAATIFCDGGARGHHYGGGCEAAYDAAAPYPRRFHSLEEELGCQLFRREGRRLYLTEMGQHFFRRAEEILGMCDNAKREVADFMDGHGGTLRIGVISSVQGTLFTTWNEAVSNAAPSD